LDAVQLVAFVEDHVRVEELPAVTEVGEAEIVAVGAEEDTGGFVDAAVTTTDTGAVVKVLRSI
jgi:hypothetical protein